MMAFWNRWKRRAESEPAPVDAIECTGVVERLYEYLDEELDDPMLVERIRKHLEICQRCHPQYRFEEAFLEFVSEMGRANMPPELRGKVFRRILEEEHSGGDKGPL